MPVDRTTILFIDAAVMIAASGRENGGSGFLLSLIRRGLLHGAISVPVLTEAERNIRLKLSTNALEAFRRFVLETPWLIADVESELTDHYRNIVTPKDLHVLAATLFIHASYLIRLDRRLIQAINTADLPSSALTPGDFIRDVLQAHPDLPADARRQG